MPPIRSRVVPTKFAIICLCLSLAATPLSTAAEERNQLIAETPPRTPAEQSGLFHLPE